MTKAIHSNTLDICLRHFRRHSVRQ